VSTVGKLLCLLGGLLALAEWHVLATDAHLGHRRAGVAVVAGLAVALSLFGAWLWWRAARRSATAPPVATDGAPVPSAGAQLYELLRWTCGIGIMLGTILLPFLLMYDNDPKAAFGGLMVMVMVVPLSGLVGFLLSWIFFRLTERPPNA
jgi:hypothetical protein